jgi:hypothetical protein
VREGAGGGSVAALAAASHHRQEPADEGAERSGDQEREDQRGLRLPDDEVDLDRVEVQEDEEREDRDDDPDRPLAPAAALL